MTNGFEQFPQGVEVDALTKAERDFAEFENERCEEHPSSWSPLITLQQLKARPDLEVEWYMPDWIPVGAKTILNGEPKCGKTILLMHVLKHVVEGSPFCGLRTE